MGLFLSPIVSSTSYHIKILLEKRAFQMIKMEIIPKLQVKLCVTTRDIAVIFATTLLLKLVLIKLEDLIVQ